MAGGISMPGRGGAVILLAFFVLGCVLVPTSQNVSADEPIGNDFWGVVVADGGDNPPSGLQVRAEVDGVTYGTGSTLNTGINTAYAMSTEGDDDSTPEKDGIVTGDLMVFWVEGYICDETYSNWQAGQLIFGVPVPTVTNLDLHYSTNGQPSLLKINEVMPTPSSGDDWIEIYNPTASAVGLGQYRVEDSKGFVQLLSGTIASSGFLIVSLSGGDILADSGEDEMKIAWQDSSGTKAGGNWVVIDRMEYGSGGSGPGDTAPSSGEMANAQLPPSGVSLELEPDGDETNHPDIDYVLSSKPPSTPGYTNTEVQPTISLLTPPSGVTNADLNYSIAWVDDDPDDNADIHLYYDVDDQPGGESLIVDLLLMEDQDGLGDQYLWDTTSVPTGLYFVKAVISDRITPAFSAYSPGRVSIAHPPSIMLLEPDGVGDVADTTFNIRWVDSDVDSNASITLRYDTDCSFGGEVLIGLVPWGEDPDGIWDAYAWNLDVIPEGQYFVKATIDDLVNTPVYSCSPGPLTVVHPPSITVIKPEATGDESHRSYRIEWTDRDADDNATISLWYDNDTASGGENLITQVPWGEDPDGSAFDSYVWNTTEVPPGYYYIKAVIDDGKSSNFSYSVGRLRITANDKPEITVLEPSEPREASKTFLITWIDHDEDDNATITLYYDTDTKPGGEILIGVVAQGSLSENNTFLWVVSDIPEGLYYIRAVITDGMATARSYSTGTVHVVRPARSDNQNAGNFLFVIIAALIVVMSALLLYIYGRRRRKQSETATEDEKGGVEGSDGENSDVEQQITQENDGTTRSRQRFE